MTAEQVPLSAHAQEFVATVLSESQELHDAAEVVDLALRRLEQERAAKLAALRAEVQRGFDDLDEGRYIEFSNAEELRAHIAQLGQDAARRVAARQ